MRSVVSLVSLFHTPHCLQPLKKTAAYCTNSNIFHSKHLSDTFFSRPRISRQPPGERRRRSRGRRGGRRCDRHPPRRRPLRRQRANKIHADGGRVPLSTRAVRLAGGAVPGVLATGGVRDGEAFDGVFVAVKALSLPLVSLARRNLRWMVYLLRPMKQSERLGYAGPLSSQQRNAVELRDRRNARCVRGRTTTEDTILALTRPLLCGRKPGSLTSLWASWRCEGLITHDIGRK